MSWNWLRHAFAVEPPGLATPSEGERTAVERLCREIVRRGLTTPALFLLELSRPLNFLSSQALHFMMPLVSAVTDARGFGEFSTFLEQRGSIDYICKRIEACTEAQGAHRSQNADEVEESTIVERPPRVS